MSGEVYELFCCLNVYVISIFGEKNNTRNLFSLFFLDHYAVTDFVVVEFLVCCCGFACGIERRKSASDLSHYTDVETVRLRQIFVISKVGSASFGTPAYYRRLDRTASECLRNTEDPIGHLSGRKHINTEASF